MTVPLIRYPLDPTGTNPDNLVVAEPHTLSTRSIRGIAPIYGPFYSNSVVVYDVAESRPLDKGIDYKIVEILQDACLKFGQEIALLILVINPDVSSNVRISYQTLGGLYQNNAAGIVDMYETVMKDERPVDWLNVLNKPLEYTPTLHRHLLEDIYGFEPVVVALERIRNAIVLSDVPAYEALIEWVKSQIKNIKVVTEAEIDSVASNSKFVTFERLLYALDKLNFNGITINPVLPRMKDGHTQRFDLSSTNLEDGSKLYWTIEHLSTDDADFTGLSGIININGNRGSFNVSLSQPPEVEEPNESFRVLIRRNSVTGPVIAQTSIVTIDRHGILSDDALMNYFNTACLYRPPVEINPISSYVVGCLKVQSGRRVFSE